MRHLFNLLYAVLLLVGLPWLVLTAIRRGKYRTGWGAKLLGLAPVRRSNAPCVWLHAVSLGEVSLIASSGRGDSASTSRLGHRGFDYHAHRL